MSCVEIAKLFRLLFNKYIKKNLKDLYTFCRNFNSLQLFFLFCCNNLHGYWVILFHSQKDSQPFVT